jgi:hypothetical protein
MKLISTLDLCFAFAAVCTLAAPTDGSPGSVQGRCAGFCNECSNPFCHALGFEGEAFSDCRELVGNGKSCVGICVAGGGIDNFFPGFESVPPGLLCEEVFPSL